MGCRARACALLPAGAIYFSMDESDVQRILAFEHTMIGSDGLPHDAAPHPRLWGTFPRVLGHYARDLGCSRWRRGHKMTGLTARTFGLADRGVLKDGMRPTSRSSTPRPSRAAATFEDSIRPAHGIDTVIVKRHARLARRQAHRGPPWTGACDVGLLIGAAFSRIMVSDTIFDPMPHIPASQALARFRVVDMTQVRAGPPPRASSPTGAPT
jgi:hypothetical protein